MSSSRRPRSLRAIILLRIVPIAALLLLLIVWVSSQWVSRTLLREIQVRVDASAEHSMRQIDTNLATLVEACQAVASNDMVVNGIIDIDHRNSTLRSYFRSLRLPGPKTQRVAMVDYKGRVILSTVDKSLSYVDTVWYPKVMAGQQVVQAEGSTLTIAVPVLYADRAEAAVVSRFDLTELVSGQFSRAETEAIVFHHKDNVLHSTNPWLASTSQPFQFPSGWLVGESESKLLPDHRVSYLESESTALAASRDMYLSQLVQFLVLLLGLVAAIRIASQLSGQPLNQMLGQVREIEDTGDLDLRVSQSGPAEFQSLADGFNGMLGKLQETTVSQKEYQASEERLSFAIEGTNDGLWDWDLESNEVWYSPRYKAMLGYTEEEFPNVLDSLQSHLHPDDAESTWQAVDQHLNESQAYDIEHRLRTKSGDYCWFRARGAVSKDAGGKPIRMSGSMQDISERRRYQVDLQNKTVELEEVLNALPISLVYASLDRKITRVNRAFTRVFGFSEEEVLGRTPADLYADPNEFEHQGHLRFNADASVNLVPYEIEYQRKDETHFIGETTGTVIVDAQGNQVGMVKLIADINRRKRDEAALRINKFALDNSSDAVFWIRADGSFSEVNQQAANFLGYSKEELCEMNVSHINPVYESDGWAEHWQETKSLGILRFETVHHRKDGTTYACFVTKHFLDFEGQELIFATARDVTAEKEAEAALVSSKLLAEESERRFRALANSAAPLCWVTDADTSCSWLNQRWLDYSGGSLAEQIGSGWAETIHPDDRDSATNAYMAAFEKQQPFAVAYRLRRHDGVYRWHTANAAPRFDDAGTFLGYVGMSFDDHDAKESREALEASELALKDASESLQATLDLLGTSDGVWDWKTDTNQAAYTPGFRKILGFDGEDHDRFPNTLEAFDSRIHPDDKAGLWEAIDECFQTQTPFAFEFRVRCKDDTYAWVRSRGNASFDSAGKPVRLVGSIFDISAQKDVELERDRFLDTAAELYAAVDTASFKWVKLNATWETTLGYPLQTLLETPVPQLSPVEEHKNIEEQVRRLLNGEKVRGWVCQTLHQDGSIRFIEWNIDPPAPGETIIYGGGRDVTAVRQYLSQIQDTSEELEVLNTQYQRSNQDLAQFAYVASHDLQEPLRAVGGFLQLLQSKYGDQLDKTANDYIDQSVSGAARMNQLINDLLHYSRVTSSESDHEPVDLNNCIAIAQEKLASVIAESDAEIRVADLPSIKGIKPLLEQLFQNLIGNAIKYRGERSPAIEIWSESNPDEVAIHVRDNGIGIAAEYQQQVFALFKRLHHRADYPGTGIGLAICQRVVERHNGTLSVESTEGQGSCFTVRFRTK